MPSIDEPCSPWAIETFCCPGWLPANTTVPDPDPEGVAVRLAAQTFATRWASNFLYKRTGRKYGICDTTVRVCAPSCGCSPCGCGPQHVIELSSDQPVVSIAQIRNSCTGDVIAADRYRVVNGRGVGLVDRTCSWLPGTIDCELEIDFLFGNEPDAEALMAGGALACAFVEKCLVENCKTDFLKMTSGFWKRPTGKRAIALTGVPLTDQWLVEQVSRGSSGMLDPSDMDAYVLG